MLIVEIVTASPGSGHRCGDSLCVRTRYCGVAKEGDVVGAGNDRSIVNLLMWH
jgi:hypothetical protein